MPVSFQRKRSSIERPHSHFDHACCSHPYYGPYGVKDVDALIDTGATYCVVSHEDVLHLGYNLTEATHVPVATAGGLIRAPQLTVTAIEVLGFRRLRVPALVKDLEGSGVKALIGWSFLDRFRLIIDAKRKWLELSPE